ncbi:hypothetical protein POP15_056 [Pectobacterium phage POP15]|nr:hypothetical protein POP15_056 [Pectobacterium phage POP15]
MKPTISPEEIAFRKHWKSLKKDVLVDKLWEMLQFINYMDQENNSLKEQVSRSNAQYLSRCRSVCGVTLPPGV